MKNLYSTVIEADERTKSGRATYHRLKRAYGLHESENQKLMGSRTVGMFHKPEEKNKSWTWMDSNKISDYFNRFGIEVKEQHSQALVTKDVEDTPVSTGNYDVEGPYGEGSASIWYFITNTERTWYFKLSGKKENFDNIDDIQGIFEDNINNTEESWLPAYDGQNYEIDISVKES